MADRHNLSLRVEVKNITEAEYDYLKKFLQDNEPVKGNLITFGETAVATLLEFKKCVIAQYRFEQAGPGLFEHSIDIFVNDP